MEKSSLQTTEQIQDHCPTAFLPRYLHSDKPKHGEFSGGGSPTQEILRELAELALVMENPTVLDKKHMPPSEDMRDYFSHSVYWWKNPETPDGFPYRYRDGQINPVTEEYDRGGKRLMAGGVRILCLAWALLGDARYAAKAAELLRAWFLDPATGMNPNMLYAQYIPGKPGEPFDLSPKIPNRWVPGVNGKGVWVSFGGVIEGSHFPALLEHVSLLRTSAAWTDDDQAGLQQWFSDFREWLMTHQHGKDEASTGQNHAVYYHLQCATYAAFAGDEDLARDILKENVPVLMEEQIEPDGSMPKEYNRGIGLQYVTFTLTAFINLAILGERLGLDFWSLTLSNGGNLRKAIEWAVPYYRGEPWPYKPFAKPFEFPNALPVLHFAAQKYPENPQFAETLTTLSEQHPDALHTIIYGA